MHGLAVTLAVCAGVDPGIVVCVGKEEGRGM